jgi:magnesium and cobalt transporter
LSDTDHNDTTLRGWLSRVADILTGEPSSRSALLEMLRHAAERELIDTDVLNTISGAIAIADMHARDVMIPRSSLVTVDIGGKPSQFLPKLIESRHSRFPVIGEEIDDVKGILHIKDLLPLVLQRDVDDFDIKDCMRPAFVIPESKRLSVLLQEFRANRNHMAIVIDEYGHISGAVTIEDIVEQVVGEIEDEFDVEEEHAIRAHDGDTFTVRADTPLEDFNDYFASDLDDADVETIGGLVVKHFGHLPTREETIVVEGFQFRVLNADTRRIRLLQLKRTA